jgi:dihydroorotate dehydrogenase
MLYALARPLLFALDPETAHRLALQFSGIAGLLGRQPPHCPVRAMGLEFPNPVGLAAGLDKHAEHVDALAGLGFGFIEVGGVTPRPQPGNPKPRLFRIPEARAIINRYGLNSVGIEVFLQNLKRRKTTTILGVNIGKNKDTPNEKAHEDYEACLEALYPHVDYVTLNVSSPNTPGLRDLPDAAARSNLLQKMLQKRETLRQKHGRQVAVALKVSPDLDDKELQDIADAARRERIDGIVATNTTTSRAGVEGLKDGSQAGGLSGAPLREKATWAVKTLHQLLGNEIPVIGVGGILSGRDAAEKFDAGAALVQLYTGLIFRGPGLVDECVSAYRERSRTASSAAR